VSRGTRWKKRAISLPFCQNPDWKRGCVVTAGRSLQFHNIEKREALLNSLIHLCREGEREKGRKSMGSQKDGSSSAMTSWHTGQVTTLGFQPNQEMEKRGREKEKRDLGDPLFVSNFDLYLMWT